MTERERFEAFMLTRTTPEYLRRSEICRDQYSYISIQDAWEVWQAAQQPPSDCGEIRRLLAEARCPADFCNGKGEVEQYRTGTGMIDRTNCTWCAVRAGALGWASVTNPQQIGASVEPHARGSAAPCEHGVALEANCEICDGPRDVHAGSNG